MRVAILAVVVSACGFAIPATPADGMTESGDGSNGGDAPDAPTDEEPLPSGLVAWYEMEAPTPAIDSTGNGHTGTCATAACPTTGTGKVGGAYEFDGTTDRIDVGSATDLRTAMFTATCWARWTDLPNTNVYSCPVGKYQGAGQGNSWQICLHGTSAGGLEWEFNSQHTAFDFLRNQTTVATSTWYHLAITWDGTTKRMYANGTQLGMTNTPAGAVQYDTGPVTLGADINSGSVDSQFHGTLDDVRIYSRVLGASEIAGLAM